MNRMTRYTISGVICGQPNTFVLFFLILHKDSDLFPEIVKGFIEFLVDAVSQASGPREPEFLFHSPNTLRNPHPTGNSFHPPRPYVNAAEGVRRECFLHRTPKRQAGVAPVRRHPGQGRAPDGRVATVLIRKTVATHVVRADGLMTQRAMWDSSLIRVCHGRSFPGESGRSLRSSGRP